MAPKRSRAAPPSTAVATVKTPGFSAPFPSISEKDALECRTLLEDQILLVDDFLTAEECKTFTKFIEGQSLELTPPKKKGEADRVNYRLSVTSTEVAQRLFSLLSPHLPTFPYPTSAKHPNAVVDRPVDSFNSHIRLYKYSPGQHFGPHYDDSVRDQQTGTKSEWTLLLYLSGVEDGVKGGETIFYKERRGNPRESIVAPLTRGTVLLHRHGQNCLLHEGSPVLDGVKYILRTDLMFKT
ncbi:hypothetical protein B0H21DRAFT_723808 [Amylocystis lapponica]|nr:hypothetical protein B0H21DRAFT_723808 [Amylocystis lapponica]